MQNKRNNVRKNTAEAFISAIQEKPLTWHCGFKSLHVPENGIHKTKYSWYNRFYLTLIMIQNGYKDNRWYSQSYIFGSKENREKDWNDPKKIKVIKGESPVYIDTSFYVPTKEGRADGWEVLSPFEYFKLTTEEQENYIKYPARKPIAVYNGEQLSGIEPYKQNDRLVLTREDVREKVERTLKNMNLKVKESTFVQTPSYNQLNDYISMPEFESYDNEYEYFATLLHEMAHATGHETRLSRDMKNIYGSPEYAVEELRAEIASCFSSQEFGLELTDKCMDNHKAYIQSWIEILEKDENILISAISDAEKIADYINYNANTKNMDKEDNSFRYKRTMMNIEESLDNEKILTNKQ